MQRVALIGHVDRSSGVAESGRRLGLALSDLGFRVDYFDAPFSNSRKTNSPAIFRRFKKEDYAFCVIVVNPDLLPITLLRYGLLYDKKLPKVGFWSWEFEEVPAIWKFANVYLDQIWTNSKFTQQAINAKSDNTPVFVAPMKPTKSPTSILDKSSNKFTFLVSFDYHSDFERKNPLAAVYAFHQAFGRNNDTVLLIIKSVNEKSDWGNRQKLKATVEGDSSIVLEERHLSKTEYEELFAKANCFVSLHRSEGFGLNIFDAICADLEVITTGYSGNMEFCDPNVSQIVDFKRVCVNKRYSIYNINSFWAEPDTQSAANIMKKALEGVSKSQSVINKARILDENYKSALAALALETRKLATTKTSSSHNQIRLGRILSTVVSRSTATLAICLYVVSQVIFRKLSYALRAIVGAWRNRRLS